MLNHKYFGMPLWTWIIIVVFILYSYNQSTCKQNNSIVNVETVKILPAEKFADIPKSKIKIFNFNTEWCGWSKRFQSEWDAFSEAIKELLPNIETIDVKCDQTSNEKMCEAYQVPGYPYVIAEINGERIPYNGERTTQALISFAKTL